MNPMAIKKALRYVAGWGCVVFFFGLLTVIFSFLGSFFCAALTGMMVGSVRLSRFQTVALSLTGPAVLYGVLRVGRTELLERQVLLLSGLGFGIFWVTYVVVRLVVSYEQKNQLVPDRRPVGSSSTGGKATSQTHGSSGGLSLQALEGKWACVANGKVSRDQKHMLIANEKLVLTVSDAFGNVSLLGEGQLCLSDHQGLNRVMISKPVLESPGDTLICI